MSLVRVLIEADCFIPNPGGTPRMLTRDEEVEVTPSVAHDLAMNRRALFLNPGDVPKELQPALRSVVVSDVIKAAAKARRAAKAA